MTDKNICATLDFVKDNPKWLNLVIELMAVPYGEVTVVMHNGEPVRLELIKEKKQL